MGWSRKGGGDSVCIPIAQEVAVTPSCEVRTSTQILSCMGLALARNLLGQHSRQPQGGTYLNQILMGSAGCVHMALLSALAEVRECPQLLI